MCPACPQRKHLAPRKRGGESSAVTDLSEPGDAGDIEGSSRKRRACRSSESLDCLRRFCLGSTLRLGLREGLS
eukprot:NODE_1299_length_629_cov_879.420690_g1022_i0.p3 GENE.NODE_1299_length_629_cov_879.420690_g1022_i0~~NODE_1299_length_629_cov_879.420690_g1022_i0.p3  ORF type:complete len:73 (+),score=2.00 NODE_1299_length_629_cov_879.420690_g1022_i0:113-331(+)